MAGRRHQLQIVDDDQAQLLVLAVQAARACAQFEGIQRRRVVDVDRRVVELADRMR